LNWRTFVYNYKKLQNYNSYTYCQFTYPIDAYAFENMIDGYEFTLIDNTAELQEIARILKVDDLLKESIDNNIDGWHFSILYKGIIMGYILLYESCNYKFYLPTPCDINLIITINKWLKIIGG